MEMPSIYPKLVRGSSKQALERAHNLRYGAGRRDYCVFPAEKLFSPTLTRGRARPKVPRETYEVV